VDVTVPVSLALYAWDAINPDQYVRKETKTVTVPANSTATVSFTVPENQEPVYLAELSLRYRDVKSYLNVRFVRDGIDKIRINFPSIGTYPLRAGEPVEVFMCMHNMADTMVGATAQLTVFDEDGEVLHTYKEDTYVHGDMGAVVSSFVPKADHATFSVLAEILVGGVVVASDTMRYECDQFGTCVEEAEPMFFDTLKHIALYLVALVALLIGIALLARLKKKN
jgi:hypothetical protein